MGYEGFFAAEMLEVRSGGGSWFSKQDTVGAKAPCERVWKTEHKGQSRDGAADMIERREGGQLV